MLDEVYRHVESTAPREGCGVVFRRPDGGHRVVPLANISPSGHTSYRVNELELARRLEEAETQGETLSSFFHSHVDAGAYFSKEDREMAAPSPEHQPLWPGVTWLVIAVDGGKATGHRRFVFKSGDFVEVEGKP